MIRYETARQVTPITLITVAAALGITSAARAEYPERVIRAIVPFATGGTTDITARMISQHLSKTFNQQVVVENRPGAAGNIGIDAVRRAAGDGCTWLVVPAGNLTINPTLLPAISYNVTRDLRPVSLLASSPNVLAVHP